MDAINLRRPLRGATPEEVAAYHRRIAAALEHLGVEHGDEFSLKKLNAQGSLLAPTAPDKRLARKTDSDTQKKAAAAIKPRAHVSRGRLLTVLCRAGERGLTDEEACNRAEPPVKLNGGSRRFGELVDGEWADIAGTRKGPSGQQKNVYVATAKALREWDY